MSLTVLGTAVPGGWPNAHCRCASCAGARATGEVRGPTVALLDRQLLLDGASGTPLDVQRAGVDLTDLRHLLVTHECTGVVELLDGRRQPVDLVGPPAATDRALRRLGPDAPVRSRVVRPGQRLRLGSYDVRVLDPGTPPDRTPTDGLPADGLPPDATPAVASVAFDVAGPTGRVLFAPAGGTLPPATVEALRDADMDVVLLGLGAGPALFADQLRRLRGVGAVTVRTDVVVCGLSHEQRSPAEVARVLDAWGARVVEDGTDLGPVPRSRATGRTLVIGGARSGKSREAELLLADQDTVAYVATSYPPGSPSDSPSDSPPDYPPDYPPESPPDSPPDSEWAERVRLHRERRPSHWTTLETIDLVPLLESEGPPLLVDCLTLWLTRVMDRHDAWDDDVWAGTGEKAVHDELDALVSAWRSTPRRVVAVTNEVGQGLVPDGAGSRRFRDTMGRLNAALSTVTEDVRWCVAGRVVRL